jgi:hypothetical protein
VVIAAAPSGVVGGVDDRAQPELAGQAADLGGRAVAGLRRCFSNGPLRIPELS